VDGFKLNLRGPASKGGDERKGYMMGMRKDREGEEGG